MITHTCIKPGCGTQYQANEKIDPDSYYCQPCDRERKALAKKIDARLGTRPRRSTISDLQAFEADARVYNGPGGSSTAFIKVRL